MTSIKATVEAAGQRHTPSRPFLAAVAKPKPFDINAVVVVNNVPYFKRKPADSSKWEPLFALLKEPGDSCAVPIHCHGGIGAAIPKRANEGKPGVYKISKESDTTSRLFRMS